MGSKPILKTVITNEKGESIGKIEYPLLTTTKVTRGTDSGRSDVFVGKTVIDGAIITYDNKDATIQKTFLTAHRFLRPDDFKVKVLISGCVVFEAEQLFRRGFHGRDVSFYKNGKHFLLQNNLFRNTWELSCEKKAVGVFGFKKGFNFFTIEFIGEDDLPVEEIIYLYALAYRPASS